MNINNIKNDTSSASRLQLDQTAGSSRTAAAGSDSSSAAVTGSGVDSIALTGSSNLVQQALNAGVDSRAARIQQLRALIQNNQYLPSAQEVSSALISAHLAGD